MKVSSRFDTRYILPTFFDLRKCAMNYTSLTHLDDTVNILSEFRDNSSSQQFEALHKSNDGCCVIKI